MTYGQELQNLGERCICLSHPVKMADSFSLWVFFHGHCCTEKFSTFFRIPKRFCGFYCGITEEPQRMIPPPVSKNPTSIHKTIQNIIQNFELKAHMTWCPAPLIMLSLIVSLLPWKAQGTLGFTIFEVDRGQKSARLPEQRVKRIKVGRSVYWRGVQGHRVEQHFQRSQSAEFPQQDENHSLQDLSNPATEEDNSMTQRDVADNKASQPVWEKTCGLKARVKWPQVNDKKGDGR